MPLIIPCMVVPYCDNFNTMFQTGEVFGKMWIIISVFPSCQSKNIKHQTEEANGWQHWFCPYMQSNNEICVNKLVVILMYGLGYFWARGNHLPPGFSPQHLHCKNRIDIWMWALGKRQQDSLNLLRVSWNLYVCIWCIQFVIYTVTITSGSL